MANNLLYTDAQSFFRAMPFSDPKTFFEAQRTAWGLNDLALNYALELNKTLLNLWKEQIGHCAAWPQRVAECRTAEEVVRVHADLIGKTTQDYKQGFDRLAGAGEEIARVAENAIKGGQDAARSMAEQPRQTH